MLEESHFKEIKNCIKNWVGIAQLLKAKTVVCMFIVVAICGWRAAKELEEITGRQSSNCFNKQYIVGRDGIASDGMVIGNRKTSCCCCLVVCTSLFASQNLTRSISSKMFVTSFFFLQHYSLSTLKLFLECIL